MNTTSDVVDDWVEKFYQIAGEEWGHFTQSVSNFVDSVDWHEPFIIGLFGYHFLVFLMIIVTRKNSTVQGILFLSLLAIVYCAQYINDLCMEHWALFSKTNYFEKTGFFISMLMSAPILLNSFIILINLVVELGNTLVQVKTKQFKREIRNKQLAKQNEGKKEK